MDLSMLIHHRLEACEELAERMAKYCGKPAIFSTEFPADQQAGWEGRTQYPRISYRVDMQVNQERASAGTLYISLFTEKDMAVSDVLENLVKGCLKDVLMRPTGEAPFCVAWAGTEPYLLEGMAVLGRDIVFDILEYPAQETTDPDPVMAVSLFIKNMYPEAVVLGIDRLEEFTDPAKRPVFYCRLEDIQSTTGHCMHTIAWFIGKVAVHLLHPDAAVRLKMISAISQQMSIDTEIIMLDQSPMTIQNLVMNNKADYLREGQLAVTGKYGCLRGGEKKHQLVAVSAGFIG